MPRVIDGVGWQNRNQTACKRYKGHYKLSGMRFKSNCVPLSVDLINQKIGSDPSIILIPKGTGLGNLPELLRGFD